MSSKCCAKSPCEVECCKAECVLDCCSLPYLRLDKLRELWSINSATGNILPTASSSIAITNVYNRLGTNVVPPIDSTFENASASPSDTFGVALTTYSSGALTIVYDNAYAGYLFVNTHRYVTFESCGKADQVIGWYVDTSSGQLELFQNLPEYNLLITDNRAYLDSISSISLTNVQKQKLYNLNNLYKLSMKAIEKIGQDPKEEGNIIQVKDKCGQQWLLTINRANSDASVASNNTQYVIVGVVQC